MSGGVASVGSIIVAGAKSGGEIGASIGGLQGVVAGVAVGITVAASTYKITEALTMPLAADMFEKRNAALNGEIAAINLMAHANNWLAEQNISSASQLASLITQHVSDYLSKTGGLIQTSIVAQSNPVPFFLENGLRTYTEPSSIVKPIDVFLPLTAKKEEAEDRPTTKTESQSDVDLVNQCLKEMGFDPQSDNPVVAIKKNALKRGLEIIKNRFCNNSTSFDPVSLPTNNNFAKICYGLADIGSRLPHPNDLHPLVGRGLLDNHFGIRTIETLIEQSRFARKITELKNLIGQVLCK